MIANLDDQDFFFSHGRTGHVAAFEFLQQHKVGCFEPYDARKCPCCLCMGFRIVPGVADHRGSSTAKSISRGFINIRADCALGPRRPTLWPAMILLRQRYQFERLPVVAHSMGGLVSRGAIQRAVSRAGTNFIPVRDHLDAVGRTSSRRVGRQTSRFPRAPLAA